METTEPVLPKWPFYIGDALLVAIALLVAWRGDGPLTALQMFWVVGAVALGACLFVLPFIVEYKTRVSLLQSERKQNIWENIHLLELAVQQMGKTVSAAKQDREIVERHLSFLEGLSQRLDQRMEEAEAEGAILKELVEKMTAVQAGTETAPATQEDGFVPGSGADISTDNDFYPEDLDVSVEPVAEEEEELEVDIAVEEEVEEPAVVIDKDGEDQQGATDEAEVIRTTDSGESVEVLDEDESEDLAAVEEIEEDEIGLEEDKAEDSATVLAQPELIAVEDAPAARRQRTKGKSVLIVNALIGIGNKPYLRGVGPGLSTDTGVPMEFLEIGKWRWIAPSADQDVRCQVYRNDETASEEGEIVLPAGQEVSLSVRFPR